MVKKNFEIIDETGLHARPATQLTQVASKFESQTRLTFQGKTVDLKSIMGVMSLGAGKGALISIEATGADDDEAIKAIEKFLIDEKLAKVSSKKLDDDSDI